MRVKGYNIPARLLYMKEHAWLSLDKSNLARIGITDYAQKVLREITFVYLPRRGSRVRRLQVVATVESVKAVSEVYSPISGQIVEVNDELVSKPKLMNQDPYRKGWIVALHPETLEEESSKLLKPKQYAEYVKRLTTMDRDLLIHRWKRRE